MKSSEVPDDLPEVDLEHLSRAVDAVLQKAILEGARMSLAEGLRFECKCFGEICAIEDSASAWIISSRMGLGLRPYFSNGRGWIRISAEVVSGIGIRHTVQFAPCL